MKIEEIYKLFKSCYGGLSTDTRRELRDTFFIAIKGENFDGNSYAENSLKNGALFAVVTDENLAKKDNRFILVKDTNIFLGELANFHRRNLKAKIIAIGGSNGKTTTKNMTATLLAEKYNISTNSANENNYFGVCFTLLKTKEITEIVVLEIGSNHMNEHKPLLEISEPDYILLTNNGKDHLGEYGGIENVKKENFELYSYAKKENKKVFVPNFEKDLKIKVEELNLNALFFSNLKIIPNIKLKFLLEEDEISLKIFGDYMLKNVACAVNIAKTFGLASEDIKKGLSKIKTEKLRGEIMKWKDNTLILDCYNANPTSMEMAIKYFLDVAEKPRALILGDMYELGKFSLDEHKKIIDLISKNDTDFVILVGEMFGRIETPKNIKKFPNWTKAREFLDSKKIENTNILVKGSRGETLEKIFE